MNSLLTNLLSLRRIEYLIIDQKLKILEMSLGVNRFVDIYEEVQLGKDIRLAFPELEGLEDVFEAIIQGKQNNFELKGIRRSLQHDHPLYINISIMNIQEYSDNKLMIIVEDVTERMVLEQSLTQGTNEANLLLRTLKASKQYIDQIVTSMADALLVTTLSGNIKKINLAAQALLEYSEAELIGQPIFNVIKLVNDFNLQIEEESNICNAVLPTPLMKEVETVCQTKSGKTIPVAFSYSIVQTEVEHFQGYVYIIRDMTERKQAELAKQKFLAMISHEIRTPITSVTGMASLLLNSELTAQQQEFVKTIYSSGEALLKIINDILDFSKIESGKLELEEQPFNLRSCINEAVSLLWYKAQEKGLKLIFIDNPELPQIIVGDITRVRQILINLLNNAIKFTEAGSVKISVITRKLLAKNTYEIQFAVTDTGMGIQRDRLERLFQAFSQVNASITRQYGGTGLGLAVCKQLCELMGGRIWVESEQNLGSKFYFTIIATAVEEKVENNKNVATDALINTCMAEEHPLRILLVEDHVINQRMIKMMLQRMGYQPDVANNGKTALSALRHQLYDVVLMDVQMPEMDGLTATEIIYQEWTPDTRPRIIALTASAMSGERDRCLASGMDDYLTKPIRIQELMQVLKKCQPLISEKKIMKELENQETINNPIHPAALYEILQIASFNSSIDGLEFLFETIDCYLEDTTRLLQDIHLYLDQANYKALRRAAHTLSSTSATLGAVNLATLCTKLEIMMANEEFIKAAGQIYLIEEEYQQVKIALENERQKYQNPR
ncbi:ATP-binding protein [Tolypothrix sp. VBCCA 56010]|uniref:ATP-binding protein n=1 Tax=Tolypothrix sp. VBCCA 56010 TaxID=3137731 RepID=UPI003D7E35C0